MVAAVRRYRHMLTRPERKPPQLFKVPYYDEAVRVFRRECDMPVTLELEATTVHGQPAWAISAFSGPRSFSGLTVNHMIPRRDYVMPTRDEVICAAACLAGTSSNAWSQRRARKEAKAGMEQALKRPIGRMTVVD